ncbi:MAG TPA: hypothetical protein DEP84_17295 [Chloroflexi bacterium]|nr:hypothetical protein [Chloroflexota bacterium]
MPAPATATPFPTVPPTLPVGATPPLATQPASPSPATPFPALERREVVAQAVADLSGRLGVEPAAVEVVDVTTDEFPVQNLGCPSGPSKEEPVRPAFVLGEIIHLRVAGVVYEYRAHGRQVVFCGQQ